MKPKLTKVEKKPAVKLERLDPGIYQDDTGRLFQITAQGQLKDLKESLSDITKV